MAIALTVVACSHQTPLTGGAQNKTLPGDKAREARGECFRLCYSCGSELQQWASGRRYIATFDDGSVVEGISDENGYTNVCTDGKKHNADIQILSN